MTAFLFSFCVCTQSSGNYTCSLQAGNLQLTHSFSQHANRKGSRGMLMSPSNVWQPSDVLFGSHHKQCWQWLGLGMTVITVCDLGHHSLAAAARASLCHLRRDSQPGCCVSAAVVLGLEGSKKRRERVKHWDRLIFFQSWAAIWLLCIFPCTEAWWSAMTAE